MMDYIPVIDLQEIAADSNSPSPKPEAWKRIAGEIRHALSNIGFMYLTNHGVGKAVIRKGFEASQKFFSLPDEVKAKYRKIPEKSSHGWVQAGQELLNPNSVYELRECFDYIHTPFRQPEFPSSMPESPEFYSAVQEFQTECNFLIRKLLKLLGLALELQDDPDYFLNCSSHLDHPEIPNETDFRAIFYPSIAKDLEDVPEGSVRCAEHTDYEIITLLFQDDVGGLEVKAANGSWVPAKPLPNSILVNTGDLLQLWTNSFFPATFHRVVIPKEEIRTRIPRYSFAYFFAPDNSTLIKPLNSKLLDKGDQANAFAPITAYEHIRKRSTEAYQY